MNPGRRVTASATGVSTPAGHGPSLLRRSVATPRFVLVVIIAVLVVVLVLVKPSFLNGPFVIAPLLTSISIFAVVGVAQMVVLSIGHMNIAVGNMAAFGAMITGITFDLLSFPLVLGIAAGLVGGALIGAFTGWIIARTGVNSFIVTLAMSFALLGLVPTVYAALSTGSAFTVKPDGFDVLGRNTFAQVCLLGYCGPSAIPIMVVPVLIVLAAVGVLYSRTRYGRELLLTGSNVKAAELSGIPTARRIVLAHTLSGLLATAAGILLACSIGSFTPAIGDEFMLQSFVGPILGGTLLAGGYVSVVGTVLGITLTLVIRKGLELFGVGIETLNVLLGIILLVALSADRVREIRLRRGRTPDTSTAVVDTRDDVETESEGVRA
ncbi:ABC transporter permease [Cnuibacter physcomitrellae]|uniref:ABC transporter permease n=1 Tax=Cnuibacter physcomitrellae TaxID=1619308 RepID=UPI002175F10B|nr:ABC transporter permease [Cnuibacter physcomitrellae]